MPIPSRSRFRRLAKGVFGFVAFAAVFSMTVAPFLGATPARANTNSPEENATVIPPGPSIFPVVVVGDVYQEMAKKTGGFWDSMIISGVITLMNTFQTVSQRLAYDMAQRILTGDSGQYPLFWESNFGDYLNDVAKQAGDQFISSVNSEFFNAFGLDLCTPLDPLKLTLAFGISPIDQLKPKCTFAQIGKAFEQTKEAFNTSAEVFDNIVPLYDPQASELNTSIAFNNKFLDVEARNQKAAELDRQETRGLKQVQDVISGNIKTPSQVIQTSLENGNLVKMMVENNQLGYSGLMFNAFKLGVTQLGTLTVSTFVNTLAVGLLQKLFEGLTGGDTFDVSEVDLAQSQAVTNRNVAKARILFSDLVTPNLISSDQQDFVGELSSCPTPRGLWGCSMDDALATALRTVGETGAYTVGRASHVILGGQPPSNSAFLHKEWELIPDSDVKQNSDPSCFQRAYCASNLAKLRYARILPVGWEMAANSPFNKKRNGKYVTLEEAIRGFNVCNTKGEADSGHPWCKLIDPNWVLSAPPFQCRVKGAGDTIFSGSQVRLEECADAVSCLGRDDRGKCNAGYGYCVAEKPVWRFTADACLERFASCRTYSTRSKEQVSYLRNTIDYGSCNADNIGCMWYSTVRDPAAVAQDVWVGNLAATSGPRIYLDATAKTCSSSDEGCTKLMEIKPGSPALNLIGNGSFETGANNSNSDPNLLMWTLTSPYVTPNPAAGEAAFHGSRSLERNPASGVATSDHFAVAPIRNYTFSIYARASAGGGNGEFDVKLWLQKADGTAVDASNVYRSPGCTWNQQNFVGFTDAVAGDDQGLQWKRFECTFVSNPDAAQAFVTIQGQNILIDAVYLEEAEKATEFVDGLSSALSAVHLRVPPDEYSCTGQASDNPACAKYARVCRQTDVGCQGYRDVQNPTAPEIPASLSAVDYCPASCVGYAEYRKQPSAFDLGKNVDPRLDDPNDDTSATFVPAYARQCSLVDVGCEEFTDVGSTSTGAEQKATYNYLRACEQPNENSETFFTWEGSDTTGYQLRTWSLIHDATQIPAGPKLIQKTGPDSILKDPSACNAQSWQTGADPDCRQFFNTNGNAFYAYFSQTVLSTPDCRDLRKNDSNAADCEKTGGTFTPASGECLYRALPSESRSCNKVNAGCRAYIGTTGRNTSVVFSEDFNGATTAPFTAGSLSNESVLVGDKSLKVATPDTETATTFPSLPNSYYSISFWAKTTSPAQQSAVVFVDGGTVGTMKMEVDWRRYEFGPFSTSSTTATSTIVWAGLPNSTFIDQIRIERLADVSYIVKNAWTVPQECDQTPEGLPEPQAMLGCRAYKDRNGVGVDVRRFGHLCREDAVGCKGFVDTRDSADPYAQTFVVNGTNVNSKVDQNGDPIEPAYSFESKYLGDATTTRPADRYLYLIDEPRARCNGANASCRAFGKPKFRQDQVALSSPSTTAFETVYLIDDITKYVTQDGEPGILCRKNELFCEEFKSGKTVAYFRTPLDHTCEWKDKVLLTASIDNNIPNDGEYTGWFRTGTDIPCYPNVLSSGNTYLIQNSGDSAYTGWVGTCPVEQSECTEFRDNNDHSDPVHPTGKPYFFIKNSRLDLKSCGGKVDLLSGCALFRDLSDARNRYNAVATYAKSAAEEDTPQTPIDCVTDPNNEFCVNAGRCISVRLVGQSSGFCDSGQIDDNGNTCAGILKQKVGGACTTNADCAYASPEGTDGFEVSGTCQQNDSNIVMKVKLDRDCAKWLGCSSAETVFDPAQQKYVDLCTDVAMCDASKGSNAGSFCAHYVDRTQEPILKQGVFFDRSVYESRETGFGKTDYSGYAIPDRFQAADLENRRVGYELFDRTPELKNKFANEYRLVAAIPESAGTSTVTFPASNNAVVDNLYPNLRICTHVQTGRTGYFMPGAPGKRVCYFSPDALTTRSVDVNNANQNVDPRNIQPLSDILRQSKDPRSDKVLVQALPTPECLAHPETDAPFPNLYVSEWNFDTQPFKPTKIAGGYEGVNLCQYGEDCDCSYRKVKYGGQTTLYYSPFGPAPLGGICFGGQKDGQSCVPSTQVTDSAGGSTEVSTTEDPGCPGGGRCAEISDVALVRGLFGQCLQRDYSRTVANDPGRYPCLIWNPNPILAGSSDIYHYQPTAGYMPPVNAGEYYCLSYANPPFETIWTAQSRTDWKDSRKRADDPVYGPGDGGNPFFYLPAKLAKFNYDRGYIAGRCPAKSDTCGNGESDCNCLDGVSNIQNVDENDAPVNRDYDEVWSAYAKGDAAAKTAIELGGVVGDAQQCSTTNDPLDNSCDTVWRFQDLGAGIDGTTLDQDGGGSWQSKWCAEAAASIPDEGDEDGSDFWPGHGGEVPGIGPAEKAPDSDYNRGRWIQTGRGLSKTYMEYFFPVKPKGVASWLFKGIDPAKITPEVQEESLSEKNFAQFQFFATNDKYLAACSIPKWYVDGVTIDDFTNINNVAQASNQIFSAFTKEFDGTLDRSKEIIVKDANDKPIKEKCSGLNDGVAPDFVSPSAANYAGDDGRCYMKAWEIDYRMDGTRKFDWLNAESGKSLFERKDGYYARERTCTKSGFAIRAMFENTDKSQNNIPEADVSDNQLGGPYHFIGFWVTACTAGTNDESFMYLNLRVKHADVCSDIGQVVAPYSRESAAFSDRVWSRGSFAIPILGFTYASNFTPFGSALVNGIPGLTPLFQIDGAVENYSPLKPPAFLGSGEEYVTTRSSPLHKWAHLSNIFARIYRIYKYYDTGVGRESWMCFGGPGNGSACPAPPSGVSSNDPDYLKKIEVVCGGKGECDTGKVPIELKNAVHRCNGLSGVNAGLDCGSNFALHTSDPVCHNAAMKSLPNGGGLEPQLTSCNLRSGWVTCQVGSLTQYAQGNCNPQTPKYNADTAHKDHNAFGCGGAAVIPNSGCSKPELKSKDCPLLVTGIQCINDDFGPMNGHCGGGYEHARCASSADCVFTAGQWWGAQDLGETTQVNNGGAAIVTYYPANGGAAVPNAFLPIGWTPANWNGTAQNMNGIGRTGGGNTPELAQAFAWHFLNGTATPQLSSTLSQRWPAPHSVSRGTGAMVIAGLCEGAEGASQDPSGVEGGIPGTGPNGGQSEQSSTFLYGFKDGYNTADPNRNRLPFALQVGQCKGGMNEGQFCYNKSDIPVSAIWAHPNTCASPVTGSDVPTCAPVAVINADDSQTPVAGCLSGDPQGDPFSRDPAKDNNKCTRSAGYQPRIDICGEDPGNEKCLLGYDLTDKQTSLDQTKALTPTDVTAGFHTPVFLGLNGANPYDYEHTAHYAPRPPMIAAPDVSRTCQSPGSCPISTVGGFTLEDQSAGPIPFGGGQGQVNMRFYGWASQDQGPLKAVYVDWGDGTVVKVDNARIKNKKPFCGTTNECTLVPGLTCSSDADCPPAGGKCAPKGTCSQSPTLTCFSNSECEISGKKGDKCLVREFFGNSTDACEQNFFEFTHAFACDKNKLPSCDGGDPDTLADKRCSGNNNITCTSASDCGPGDTCIAGLAPPSTDGAGGGCFDSQKNACIFTPKVMLKDSWNWCSGECRAGQVVGNEPTDISSTKVRHVYGGCWDGTETMKNTNITVRVMSEGPNTNECYSGGPSSSSIYRPWIIYQGGVEIGALNN